MAQPKPDYEKMAIDIMPSDKAITVPVKPNFASDNLPEKVPKPKSPKQRGWVFWIIVN